MEKQVKEAYGILGIKKHIGYDISEELDSAEKRYEPIAVRKLFLPEDAWSYDSDGTELIEKGVDYSELSLDETNKELIMVIVSSLSQDNKVIGAMPAEIYAIGHTINYDGLGDIDVYDKAEICEYFSKTPLLRVLKSNDGIKVVSLDEQELKHIKIDLYQMTRVELSQIKSSYDKNALLQLKK